MKRLIIDLDDTLTLSDPTLSYANKEPNLLVIAKVKSYKLQGFEIVIYSARNMRTFNNSVGRINANTLPVIVEWLNKHEIPYDELHVGKPWCGLQGFYVDDKAIRPSEFISMDHDQISELVNAKA